MSIGPETIQPRWKDPALDQIGFRDLESMIMGGPLEKPVPPAPAAPLPPADPAPAAAPAPASVFAADQPQGTDALARTAAIGRLVELAAHARSETPFCIGVLGAAGAGKSFALQQVVAGVAALSAAAGHTETSPFLGRILIHTVDAAALDGDAATALASEVYDALAHAYPEVAAEAAHAVADPHVAVREAGERLDSLRRQLETERRSLEDVDGRRARLVETLLYETPGARVDSYARANGGRIEAALARFEIGNEGMRTYKELVRMAADGGSSGRVGMALRTLWAFKGQTRLIVTAVILVAIGVGLGIALETQASWIGWLRNSNPSAAPAAAWMETHVGLLGTLRQIAWLGAALALLLNLWRALRFLQPIFRGATLLQSDVAQRRRDLDASLAHQTRRVDGLASEAEAAGRRLKAAQQRADARGPAHAAREPSPFAAAPGSVRAQRFFEAVAALATTAGAPQRIVVALDNLDGVAPARAQDILGAAQRLMRSSFLLVAALDPHRLDAPAGDLEKWVQIPLNLDALPGAGGHAALVQALLVPAKPGAPVAPPDAKASALDRPFSKAEVELLTALAPLAGRSPRAVKRFVNLYRLARTDAGGPSGATALMLALQSGDTPQWVKILEQLAHAPDDAQFDVGSAIPAAEPALADRIAAVDGAPLTAGGLRAAAAVAAPFSLHA